ncbi:MAG: hypothetical protein ACK5PS_17775 [Desulfopila sp.]
MLIAKRSMTCCLLFFLIGIATTTVQSQESPALPADNGIAEFGHPVSADTLGTLRGGQNIDINNVDMLINKMNVNSALKDNVLGSATTGANLISNEAFSHASGISTVIQNSGNQVVINSALILNVRLQ